MTGTPDSVKNRELMLEPNGPVANAFSLEALMSSTATVRQLSIIGEQLEIGLNHGLEAVALRYLITKC